MRKKKLEVAEIWFYGRIKKIQWKEHASKKGCLRVYGNRKNTSTQNLKKAAETDWAHNEEGGVRKLKKESREIGEKRATFLTSVCQ